MHFVFLINSNSTGMLLQSYFCPTFSLQAENGLSRKYAPNSNQEALPTGRCLAFNVSTSKQQAMNHAPNPKCLHFGDEFDSPLKMQSHPNQKIGLGGFCDGLYRTGVQGVDKINFCLIQTVLSLKLLSNDFHGLLCIRFPNSYCKSLKRSI